MPQAVPQGDILGKLLSVYLTIFSWGYANTIADAFALLRLLATIEMVLLGLYWAVSEDHGAGVLLTKLFVFTSLAWLLAEWPTLMDGLRTSFIQWGITAGAGRQSVLTVADFTNPGNLFSFGAGVATILIRHAQSFSAMAALWSWFEIAVTGVCALVVLAAFGWMAIQIAVTLLEFYLGATMAMLLLPLGAFGRLASLSEQTIARVLAYGIKLAVLAFLTSTMQPALTLLSLPEHPNLDQMLMIAVGAALIGLLSIKGPAFAQSMLSGIPVFSAAGVAAAAVTLGGLAGVAGAGVAGVIGSTARTGVGITRHSADFYQAGRTGGAGAVGRMASSKAQQMGAAMAHRVLTWGKHAPQGRGVYMAQRLIPHD